MTITTREQVLFAVRRAINLGASYDEAIASVAQALHLSQADMTLRDYFAAQAMAEMNWEDFDGSARDCYEIADAMLRAREAA